MKRSLGLWYKLPKKKQPPATVPFPMLVTPRKHRGKPVRLSSPRTPFVYTEHNRLAVSGENGTFLYKVPDMFTLERDREVLHMRFAAIVDILRLVTKSAERDWYHYRGLYTLHMGCLKRVCRSVSFTDLWRTALVGRTYRMEYRGGVKTINRFTIRLDQKFNEQDFAFPFQFSTSLDKDQNGNLVVSCASLPLEMRERNLFMGRLRNLKKTELFTGKGFVHLDLLRPIQLKGKGQGL